MLKERIKKAIGIILTIVGIYIVLAEMVALIGEYQVLFSGTNLYLFMFFILSGVLLIYFGIKLIKVRHNDEKNG